MPALKAASSAVSPTLGALQQRVPVLTRLQVITEAVGKLSTLLMNGMDQTPGNPGTSLWTLAAWARREFDYTLKMQLPNSAPMQVGNGALNSGLVFGTLNAVGPAANPVSYKVLSGPTRGAVDIAATGIYTYKANADLAVTGGADAFTVQITDTGFHLQNLLGIPNNSTQVTVPVLVAPQGEVAPNGRVFHVVNYSSTNVRYVDGTFTGLWLSTPERMVPIRPGEEVLFTVDPRSEFSASVKANFADYPPAGSPAQVWQPQFYSSPGPPLSACGGNCIPLLQNDTTTVYLFDPPGTVKILSNDEAQKQADVLNAFCTNPSAQCNFVAKGKPESVQGNKHIPTGFSPVTNRTNVQIKTTIKTQDAVTTITSYNVKATVAATLFKVVKTIFEAEYGQTINETHTFEQSIEVPVEPGHTATIYATQPMYRLRGDYTVSIANTKYILQDVTIDIPNPNGSGSYEVDSVLAPATESV